MMYVIEYCAAYLGRYLRDTRGVAAMEYAIIAGVVVVGVGAAALTFSGQMSSFISAIGTNIGTTGANIGATS